MIFIKHVGIKLVRAKTALLQIEFSACLNINLSILQEWEQGISVPTGPDISLLNIVEDHPSIFLNKMPKNIESENTGF